jgi:hypothetical protein
LTHQWLLQQLLQHAKLLLQLSPAPGQHAAAAAALPCCCGCPWLIAVPAVMDVFCWLLLGPEGQLGAAPWPTDKYKRPTQAMRYIRGGQHLGSSCDMSLVNGLVFNGECIQAAS